MALPSWWRVHDVQFPTTEETCGKMQRSNCKGGIDVWLVDVNCCTDSVLNTAMAVDDFLRVTMFLHRPSVRHFQLFPCSYLTCFSPLHAFECCGTEKNRQPLLLCNRKSTRVPPSHCTDSAVLFFGCFLNVWDRPEMWTLLTANKVSPKYFSTVLQNAALNHSSLTLEKFWVVSGE